MTAAIQTCYRHPDRRAGVTCQRCDRPICPQCMSQASVGFHCPECSKQGKQKVYTARTIMGGSHPIVTQALIAVNVLVYFLGASDRQFATDYGLLGSGRLFFNDGTTQLVGVAHGEWYRLVTGGFLHANILHLGMNMFALWILGSQLEAAVGRLRFGVVYAAALLAGSLGVMLVSPNELTVGASGAIFGLLGLALAAQRSQGINIWQSGLGGILLINLAFTFGIPGISIGGHLGGLAGGYLCGAIFYELGPRVRDPRISIALCSALGLLCFAGALVAASALAV
jgi:membrane associated rhomboid family serine protease